MSVDLLSGVKMVGTNLGYTAAYASGGVALLGMVELARRSFLAVIGENNRKSITKKAADLNASFWEVPSALIPYAKKGRWQDVAQNTAGMWLCSSILFSQLARNGKGPHPILQSVNPFTSRIF